MTRDVLPDCCVSPKKPERKKAAEAVKADPDLHLPEREFKLIFDGDQECAWVDTEIASTMRGLL